MSENNQTTVSTLMTTIMKARDEALKRDIDANTIIIDKKLRYVKPFNRIDITPYGRTDIMEFKPMIFGMEIDIVDKIPLDADFIVYKADETYNHKLEKAIKCDAIDCFSTELKDNFLEVINTNTIITADILVDEIKKLVNFYKKKWSM